MHPQKKVKADVVTDEQGRRRFHGAFTGGFSAGHFNTVGSVEGWTPKTFVSSRSQRAPRMEQRVQDLMDGEDGFLGGVLATKEEFDTFGTSTKQRLSTLATQSAIGSAIPGPMPAELIVASSSGIGQSLLKLMGWREGQGVGSRRIAAEIPEGIDISRLPQAALQKGELTDLDKQVVTFAPSSDNSSSSTILPVPKADMYGLGYDHRRAHPEMAAYLSARGGDMTASEFHSNVYRVSSLFGEDKKSSTNAHYSGFAIDDDDDNGMYDGETSISALPAWQEKDEAVDQSVNSAAAAVASRQRCVTDGRPPLHGFMLALRAADAFTAPAFLPPLVPDGFKPQGPPPPMLMQSSDAKSSLCDDTPKCAERTVAQTGPNKSVFNLLGADAKERILQSIRNTPADTPELREKLLQTTASTPLVASVGAAPAFVGMAEALQSRFAASGKLSSDAPIKPTGSANVSRYEHEGLHHAASIPSVEAQVKPPEPTPTPRRVIPPNRVTVAWLPARLLSKRMNVAVPSISPDIAMHTSVSSVSVSTAIGGAAAAPTKAREEVIFDEHVRKYAADKLFATALNTSSDPSVNDTVSAVNASTADVEPISGTGGEVEVRPEDVLLPPRPPISLFKSIFEDSSSDESGSESETEDEKTKENENEATPVISAPVINEDVFRKKPKAGESPVVEQLAEADTSEKKEIDDGKIVFNKPRSITTKRDTGSSVGSIGGSSKRKKIVVAVEEDDEEGLTIRPCNARSSKNPINKMVAPDRAEVNEAIHHLAANKESTNATIGKLSLLLQGDVEAATSSNKKHKKESKKKSKKKKHKTDKKKNKKKERRHNDESDSSSSDSSSD